MRNTRSKKTDLWTPLQTTQSKRLFEPKFDPSKPLTAAREPKQGETLVSLAGSPVVTAQLDHLGDDSHLVSILMLSQSTTVELGGRLFLDERMSPNTVSAMNKAVRAINAQMEIVNSQMSATGTLDQS